MFSRFASAFAVACLVLGCSSTPHTAVSPTGYATNDPPPGVMTEVVPVWIDKNFTYAHRQAVHLALAEWNISLNGYERFEIVSDSFDMEVEVLVQIERTGQGLVVLSRTYEAASDMGLPDGVLAWVPMSPGEESNSLNIVEDVIGNRDLKTITMHELGHVLGVPHIYIRNTLMFPMYPNSNCIDRTTVQELATIRRWDWRAMNWCVRP